MTHDPLHSSEVAAPSDRRRATRVRRAALAAVPLVFVALLAYGLLTGAPTAGIDDNLAQARAVPAPAFSLAVLQRGDLGPQLGPRLARALADGKLSLRELRGTPVVLNFWASWCIPCREEAPLLQRTWREQARPREVLFLGLDMQDVAGDARDFMRTFDISYLNIRDPGNGVARRYGVTGIPTTFFLTARGKIVGHVLGVANPTQLSDGIAAALSGRVLGARRGGALRPPR